jgi:hypothetical protein
MASSEAWLKMADRSMRAEQGATTRGQNEFPHSKSPYHCVARALIGRSTEVRLCSKADVSGAGGYGRQEK